MCFFVSQDRDALTEQLGALLDSSSAGMQELATRVAGVEEERSALKDQVRACGHLFFYFSHA